MKQVNNYSFVKLIRRILREDIFSFLVVIVCIIIYFGFLKKDIMTSISDSVQQQVGDSMTKVMKAESTEASVKERSELAENLKCKNNDKKVVLFQQYLKRCERELSNIKGERAGAKSELVTVQSENSSLKDKIKLLERDIEKKDKDLNHLKPNYAKMEETIDYLLDYVIDLKEKNKPEIEVSVNHNTLNSELLNLLKKAAEIRETACNQIKSVQSSRCSHFATNSR